MFTYSLAKTGEERQQSKELVIEAYLKQGYLSTDDSSDVEDISDVVSKTSSITILARQQADGKLVGTATLVPDSSDGLPMDVIFKSEIDTVRQKEKSIAEVCQLTIKHGDLSKSKFDINLDIFSHVLACAKKKGITALCFTVNPKHQAFYQLLNCTQLGDQRAYPLVNKNPAIAFYLNIDNFINGLENQPAFIRESLNKEPGPDFFDSLIN
jgi:hypothetical protein